MVSCCVFVVRRWQVPPLRLPPLVAPVPVPEIAGNTGNAAVAVAPAILEESSQNGLKIQGSELIWINQIFAKIYVTCCNMLILSDDIYQIKGIMNGIGSRLCIHTGMIPSFSPNSVSTQSGVFTVRVFQAGVRSGCSIGPSGLRLFSGKFSHRSSLLSHWDVHVHFDWAGSHKMEA